jgi:hypothetical protein
MLDHDLLKAQERYTNLLNEAQEWRLACESQHTRPRHELMHSRVLDRFGKALVAWGWRLRARYGNLEAGELGLRVKG